MAFVSLGATSFGPGLKKFQLHDARTCVRVLPAKCCVNLPSFIADIKPGVGASLSERSLGIESLIWKNRHLTISISTLADIRNDPDCQGATSEDCAFASRIIGDFLDDAEVDETYTLEVTTPGTKDEITKDREFDAFKSFPVRVELRQEEGKSGKSDVVGTLQGRSATSVDVNVKGRKVSIPRESVLTVKLISES